MKIFGKPMTIFGRPMTCLDRCMFVDKVTGEPVGIYRDESNGKTYLATSAWTFFRLEWPWC